MKGKPVDDEFMEEEAGGGKVVEKQELVYGKRSLGSTDNLARISLREVEGGSDGGRRGRVR